MTLADKLLDKLIKADNDCWEFVGGITGSGYGAMKDSEGKQHSTHVLAYKLWRGPIQRGQVVRHSCNNKICCNPSHLSIGTYQDNKNDEVKAGTHIKGSKHGNSKLTESDVIDIKRLILEDSLSIAEISRMYKVTWEAIHHIRNGTNWGWLQ